MSYISAGLRRQVVERAGNCCEYCLLSREDSFLPFQVDHVIAEKHDGETHFDNLSWSCPNCNIHKGSDIGSIDRETRTLVPLFNPRSQRWEEHFHLTGAIIEPLTPEGRVTVRLLRFNLPHLVEERQGLLLTGRYPCIHP